MRPERRLRGRTIPFQQAGDERVLIPGFVFGFGRMGWRDRAKSREREGSALALNAAFVLTMQAPSWSANSAGRT